MRIGDGVKVGTTQFFTLGFVIGLVKKTQSSKVQQNPVLFGFITNKLR